MTQIKICGITRRTDALTAAACGADALGFIFYAGSPRHVTPETVRAICRDLPDGVVRIGVFVNEEPSNIIEIVDNCGIDLIQLHGDEQPDDCRQIAVHPSGHGLDEAPGGKPAAVVQLFVAVELDHVDAAIINDFNDR